MTTPILIRFRHANGIGIGLCLDEKVFDITKHVPSIAEFLRASCGQAGALIEQVTAYAKDSPVVGNTSQIDWLAPVDCQEVWAAGVTYERSRDARKEEAQDGGDVYARVYEADRPELFFKGLGSKVTGHLGEVGIRFDSHWNVPEPELALVINPMLEVVGITVGNDMSSRDIEGANPLYLPQAKVYNGSCALGPGIALGIQSAWPATTIQIEIHRNGAVVFSNSIHTSQIHRSLSDLVSYLGRCNAFPDGAVLLTGTGIVPPNDFTLQAGDKIHIHIDNVGHLINTVRTV